MPRYFLARLEIEGFRGINNEGEPLSLGFSTDAVNSIFAANGLGKSSIFEALSYAIRGVVPKLDGLHATDKSQDYYANRFHSGGTATITMTLRPDDSSPDVVVRVQRAPNGTRTVDSPSGHPDPHSLLHNLDGESVLLDYRSFVSFVEESPLRRGRTFSALLGLGRLSEFRQALETLAHNRNLRGDLEIDSLKIKLEAELRKALEAIGATRSGYKAVTGKDLAEPLSPKTVAADTSAALRGVPLLQQIFASADVMDVDFERIRATIRAAEGSEKRNELVAIVKRLGTLEDLASGSDEPEEQGKLRIAIERRDKALSHTRGAHFQRLYNALNEFFESGQWKEPQICPACESSLDDPLAPRVADHLDQYADAKRAQDLVRDLWTAGSWVGRLKRLIPPGVIDLTDATRKRAGDLDERFRLREPSLAELAEAVSLLAEADTLRHTALTNAAERKELLEKELPPSLVTLTEQVEAAERVRTALRKYQDAVRAGDGLRKRLRERKRWMEFIEAASSRFSDAEVALSTAQTIAVERHYRPLYEQITQNPEVVPALKKATGTEDLYLRLEKFYGLRDLSAATLLPESYRNALAISIYLSAATKSRTTARFIVLDDVTSSFDAGHQFNLMEILRNGIAYPGNPDGLQVIVLSHDGLLEKYFDRLSSEAVWHHQRLQGLPPRGTILSQAQDARRLRATAQRFLNAGQIEPATPLIRQYLEYSLLEVIRHVKIPVALDFSIRDDRKIVGNAIDAIQAAVGLHQRARTLVLDSTQMQHIDKVHMPALIANWVTHYATGIMTSLSPHLLLGVLTTIDELGACFKYTCRCSSPPTRRFYKNLSEKHCGC